MLHHGVINTQVIETLFHDFVINMLQDLDTNESRHLVSKVGGMKLKELDHRYARAQDADHAFAVEGLRLKQFYKQDPISKEISRPIQTFSRSGRGQGAGGAQDVEKQWADFDRQQYAPQVQMDGKLQPLWRYVCFPRVVSLRFTPDEATRTQLGSMVHWRQNQTVGRGGRTENWIVASTIELYGSEKLYQKWIQRAPPSPLRSTLDLELRHGPEGDLVKVHFNIWLPPIPDPASLPPSELLGLTFRPRDGFRTELPDPELYRDPDLHPGHPAHTHTLGHRQQKIYRKRFAVPFTVPSPLAPLYAYFPLLTVSNDDSTTPAPSKPTLWVLGPPPTGHKESLDPVCRQAQAFARFSQLDAQPHYLQHGQGAPGGTLPALHLPQGDLIETEGVNGAISAGRFSVNDDEEKQKRDKEKRESDDVTPQDPILQAYTSLVETTLLPAVVAALYLLSHAPPVIPSPSLPFLSQLASKWLGISKKQERIAQVKRLRGGKVGSKVVLDLEEVEREAVEALQALEDKITESRGDSEWFLGASSPSQLDALLYSLLSIISVLPSKGDNGLLRTTLERCPALCKWYKSHDP